MDFFKNRYFCRSPKKEVISIQRGVFRVNCYDCGQRTTTCQVISRFFLFPSNY